MVSVCLTAYTSIRCLADDCYGVAKNRTVRGIDGIPNAGGCLTWRIRGKIWLRYLRWRCSRLPTLNASGLQRVRKSSCSSPCASGQVLCDEALANTAMDVLLLMDQKGTVPPVNLYRSLLKECLKRKDLAEAKRIYAHLSRYGLESARCVAEDVVSTLVKCNGLLDALQVFNGLPQRSVFSWTAIISGYTIAGQGRKALRMYDSMREEGLQPDNYVFRSLIRACGGLSDLNEGKRIHLESLRYNCASNLIVGTCLIDMYGKCGSPLDARSVFDGLPQPDAVSWNAMLAVYVQQGQAELAFLLYEQMLEDGISGNSRTSVTLIQACGILAEREEYVMVNGLMTKPMSLGKGKKMHSHAQRKGQDGDGFVGTTLLNMYMKCRSPMDVQNVFNRSIVHDVVTWSSMLAAYVEQGEAEMALQLYEQMFNQAVSPNCRTFVSVFHACGLLVGKEEEVGRVGQMTNLTALSKGKVLHAYSLRKGYCADIFVGNSLVSMYGKCGSLVDAQAVFDSLSQVDVVSWNALLASYSQQGQAKKALQLYEQMLLDQVTPTDRTFVSALQACGMLVGKADVLVGEQGSQLAALHMGKAIHAEASIAGYTMDVFVGNSLLSMYGKCGSITDAQSVLDGLCHRDVMSWTAMMTSYAQYGQAGKALQLFEQMVEDGVSPVDVSFLTALQACGILADKEEENVLDGRVMKVKYLGISKALHADAWQSGHRSHVFIGNALVSTYGKCGSILDAQYVFDCLSEREVVSWNVMLAVCAPNGQAEECLQKYDEMQKEGISPDEQTYVSVLQACSMIAEDEEEYVVNGQSTKVVSLGKGKAMHADAWRKGFYADAFVGSTLVTMYMKCGSSQDAQDIFDRLLERDVVAWTALLTAYGQQRQAGKALQLYAQMREEGVSPNSWTFVSVCQACSMLADEEPSAADGTKIKSLQAGRAIHAAAWRKGYVTDVVLGKTLVTMYGKCGSVLDAQIVFDGLCHRNVVSWTAILAAHAQHTQGERAMELYTEMKKCGVSPNEVTWVCILHVCSNSGALGTCRQIHRDLESTGTELSRLLATSLLHAYGRCGSMVDAQSLFDALPLPDLVSWTTLIACYAKEGNCTATLHYYKEMQLAGVKPDGVTFLSLLYACSHAGLVEQGVAYFGSMMRDHGIPPGIQHYVSMVDLLGRAGCFTRVQELLSTMPMQPNLAIWLCLLGACQKYGELAMGQRAFESAVSLEPTHSASYVMMATIFADAGLWELAKEVATLRQAAGAWKQPGQSWIEHEQHIHKFLVGASHEGQAELVALLGKLSLVFRGMEEAEVILDA